MNFIVIVLNVIIIRPTLIIIGLKVVSIGLNGIVIGPKAIFIEPEETDVKRIYKLAVFHRSHVFPGGDWVEMCKSRVLHYVTTHSVGVSAPM